MLRTELDAALDQVLSGRRLLAHPFYRRWEAGLLERAELAAYAGQYRHFEAALPELIEEIIDGLEDPVALELMEMNLTEERSVPAPHLELFDEFVSAVGGQPGAPSSPAATALVSTYRDLAQADPVAGIAAFAAYEVQSAEIASSKASGLRRHYGLTQAQTYFWDVHASMDAAHSSWTLDALASVADDPTSVGKAARLAADAWWSFLNEREEDAASLASSVPGLRRLDPTFEGLQAGNQEPLS